MVIDLWSNIYTKMDSNLFGGDGSGGGSTAMAMVVVVMVDIWHWNHLT